MPRYLLVLDFEATCDQYDKYFPHEIIEFPTVVLDTQTMTIIDEFHEYVRPHEELTPFCIELTGIQQRTANDGDLFLPVYSRWKRFVGKYADDGLIVTFGDWDLKSMLPLQFSLVQLECSELHSYRLLKRWIDIRALYNSHSSVQANKKYAMAHSLRDLVDLLGLTFRGRNHSGIDDCLNTAACAVEMLLRGYNINVPNSIRK